MDASYQIYIEKKSVNYSDLYRIFVQHKEKIEYVSCYVDKDFHQKIWQGKVVQTFPNNRIRIQLNTNTYVYTERSFKGRQTNIGEIVWVQTTNVSSLEAAYKDPKGTLNVALPCGPVILHPFETGVHISQRLKQYPEFANSLKKHFEPFAGRCGIKFRLSAKDYSLALLEEVVSFLKITWDERRYNRPEFLILNSLLSYFLFPTEVFTNDSSLADGLSANLYAIFQTKPKVRELPQELHSLEEAWESSCRNVIPLAKGGSVMIQETPACIAIDVNAGSETSYDRVNREVIEMLPQILYQGRFGGKVVVDLLPVSSKDESERLLQQFKANWYSFDVVPQLFGISRMGLLEFILPRRGHPLWWIDKNSL